MNRPSNLAEWSEYIQGLSGSGLYSQAIAANTHSFTRTLVAEGATTGDVEKILLLFVRRLRATGVKVPEGGAFDLVTMALVDQEARKGPTHSVEETALLDVQDAPVTGGDDLDDFELDAGFDDA
jgi:hypothetical protein